MTDKRPLIWCYAGTDAGPLAEIVKRHPDGDGFTFAEDNDRARFRRRIEDALRKTASDWDLVLVADVLNVRLD